MMEVLPSLFKRRDSLFAGGEHQLKDLDDILGLMEKVGVPLKMPKFRLSSRIDDYLGHKILPGKLYAAPEPTKDI